MELQGTKAILNIQEYSFILITKTTFIGNVAVQETLSQSLSQNELPGRQAKVQGKYLNIIEGNCILPPCYFNISECSFIHNIGGISTRANNGGSFLQITSFQNSKGNSIIECAQTHLLLQSTHFLDNRNFTSDTDQRLKSDYEFLYVIHSSGNSTIHAQDCVFQNNTMIHSVIAVQTSILHLSRCSFISNSAVLQANQSSSLFIHRCLFHMNRGVTLYADVTDVHLSWCTFTMNSFLALFWLSSSLDVSNSKFINNYAPTSGDMGQSGMWCCGCKWLNIENSTFSENNVGIHDALFSMQSQYPSTVSGTLTLKKCKFDTNRRMMISILDGVVCVIECAFIWKEIDATGTIINLAGASSQLTVADSSIFIPSEIDFVVAMKTDANLTIIASRIRGCLVYTLESHSLLSFHNSSIHCNGNKPSFYLLKMVLMEASSSLYFRDTKIELAESKLVYSIQSSVSLSHCNIISTFITNTDMLVYLLESNFSLVDSHLTLTVSYHHNHQPLALGAINSSVTLDHVTAEYRKTHQLSLTLQAMFLLSGSNAALYGCVFKKALIDFSDNRGNSVVIRGSELYNSTTLWLSNGVVNVVLIQRSIVQLAFPDLLCARYPEKKIQTLRVADSQLRLLKPAPGIRHFLTWNSSIHAGNMSYNTSNDKFLDGISKLRLFVLPNCSREIKHGKSLTGAVPNFIETVYSSGE